MWQAKFLQSLPEITAQAPAGARWLFMTFTVKNCPVDELRSVLQDMSQSWRRLCLRKEFASVLGWVRTTEVTRSKSGEAHPHYHCLMLVPASYFGKNYIKQGDWVASWRGAARLDYDPVVDVRTVKPPKDEKTDISAGIRRAVAETLKYSVKPSDMVADERWFLEMTKQTHKLRFIATGGILKNCLKPESEITQDDLLLIGEGEEIGENSKPLLFDWQKQRKKYKKRNGE